MQYTMIDLFKFNIKLEHIMKYLCRIGFLLNFMFHAIQNDNLMKLYHLENWLWYNYQMEWIVVSCYTRDLYVYFSVQ